MKLSPEHKVAGILEPVFAIRTEDDLGIGDTDGVRQMMDWCHRHGLNIFQTLPINETADHHGPYDAISSMAIDPLTVAVSPKFIPDLSTAKFERLARPAALKKLREGNVNYKKVRALKAALLLAAFDCFVHKHFNPGTARGKQLHQFLAENSGWLPDYSLYRMLMEENGNNPHWERWPEEQQSPAQARAWLLSLPEKQRERRHRRQLYFAYVQWLAYDQWTALKKHGDKIKVWLMGDIPFGVGRFSADVWANRGIFDLDWSGGAPPEMYFKGDVFVEKWGQNWGVPNYRWDELRRRNYSWWRTRIDNIRKVFHLYRIDHVLGFFRIYSFPWPPERNQEFRDLDHKQAAARTHGRLPGFRQFPDDTFDHKAANQKQGEEILRFVLEASGDTVVVAEDLGMVPEYVPPTLKKLRIPGFRIPNFFRETDGRYCDPADYPRISLAQPATHDHPPLAAAWADHWKHIDAGHDVKHNLKELRHLLDFAGIDEEEIPREFTARLTEAYLRNLLRANSWLAVAMVTDVFGLKLRFNTPGTVSAENWAVRLPRTVNQMKKDRGWVERAGIFAKLVKTAGRRMG